MIVLRYRIKVEKIVEYHVGQAFFHQVDQDWKLPYVLPGVVGKCLHSRGGLPEDIEFT